MMHSGERGGVEEKKEDSMDQQLSPSAVRNSSEEVYTEEEHSTSFQAQWQRIASAIFGSCGSAIEAAAFFVQQQGCRWPSQSPMNAPEVEKPPLSIADELRRLAQQEGRIYQQTTPRRADIPKFLGEEAVYSFEDDNISAISQNTLEEMARHGVLQAQQYARTRRQSSNTPPSPASSESSKKKRKKLRDSSFAQP